MRKSSLLGHTIQLLDVIRSSKRPADKIAQEFFRARGYLGSSDRRYISEFVFGVLRNMLLLQTHAGEVLTGSHEIPSVGLCAVYAVKLLGEDPIVLLPDIEGLWRLSFSDVDCSSCLASFKASTLPASVMNDPGRRIAVEQSMPESIVREWLGRFGTEETERLCLALNQPAPTAVRVNTLKSSVEKCRALLASEGVATRIAPLARHGLIFEKRVNTQALQAFRSGLFEVQDEGSQMIPLFLGPLPGECVVDACAGGGGKTLQMAALMQDRGALYAIDIEERRLANIGERIKRSGTSIVTVLLAGRDNSRITALQGKADAVLVDAPCTGVGTFRRNPGAKASFSADSVAALTETQHAVLQKYSSLVKEGGRLVYATCSLLWNENEAVVGSFLAANPEFRLVSAEACPEVQGATRGERDGYCYFFPHKTSTDGFFVAVMVRDVPIALPAR